MTNIPGGLGKCETFSSVECNSGTFNDRANFQQLLNLDCTGR